MTIYLVSMVICGLGFYFLEDKYGIHSVLSKRMKEDDGTDIDEESVGNYLLLFSITPILNTLFAIKFVKHVFK